METFIDIFFLAFMSITLIINYYILERIKEVEECSEFFRRKFITTMDIHGQDFDHLESQLERLSENFHLLDEKIKDNNDRFLLALQENLQTTKPMKPNNWDSVKEVFKRPTRIEVNERT